MTHRIPFNYDLYLTGKYRAVHRTDEREILCIEPYNSDLTHHKYVAKTDSGPFFIDEKGFLWPDNIESYCDVFLEFDCSPFHLPDALKGAKLITRDGRDVRDFKPNPDQAGPKAYIAMVGDDLMYYHPSGCVNRSCEPHPLDLFIKIN